MDCGLVFCDPMPADADLDDYNNSYFSSAHGGQATNPSARAFFSAIAKLRLSHIDQYCAANKVEVGNVLELGPGTGYLAKAWMQNHRETRYFVVETDSSCYKSLEEIGVSLLDLSTMESDLDEFDLVIMSHVLEHVPNPLEFLKAATKNLRKGGVLFIEVPCHDFVHKNLDEPHVLFFDKKSLGCLLDNLGFEAAKLSYHGRTLEALKRSSWIYNKWNAIRSKLISLGIALPFSGKEAGLEVIDKPIERAVIKPYQAHIESAEPAWWLRALAIKR